MTTHLSFLQALGVLAVSMLLMVSGAALVHADTNYNEPVSADTSVEQGAGGAGDATAPGIPNTGPETDNTMWFVFAVVAIGLAGAAAYYVAGQRRSETDLL